MPSDVTYGANTMSRDHATPEVADLGGARVLEIASRSSHDFLDAAFAAYAAGTVFAISRPDTSLEGMVGRVERVDLPDAPRLGWGRPTHAPSLSDAPAQIVFTSGTEGRPKAIVLSHRNLADVVRRLDAAMELAEEVREYVGVPVTYSFGMGRARAVAAAGGAVFLPERFDPAEMGRMLARGEINAASAVPSLWRLALAAPEAIGEAGEAMRWIEIGSQHMAASDKAALRRLFPRARIVQHYGLTEASRTTFLDVSRAPEALLGSVGEATSGAEVRIGEDGAVRIRGDHVAMGRLGPGGAITPLADAEGWLRTRDRGEIRDGKLWYLGRLDDQINLAGIKVGAESLEAEVARIVPAAAGRIAAAALPDAARGEVVLLAHEAGVAPLAEVIAAAARAALAERGVSAPGALRPLEVDALPRTGTDKIRRAALPGLWEAAQAEAAPGPQGAGTDADAGLSGEEARLAEAWRRVAGPVPLAAGSSFYDAGGDSLSAVQIGLLMEREGWAPAAVRATFEGRSLREVARIAASPAAVPLRDEPAGADPMEPVLPAGAASDAALPDRTVRNWAISMARGVMALSVLVSHWGPGLFGALGIGPLAERWISTVYRAGTPGFAAVFGIGVGYFMLAGFAERSAGILSRMAASFRLVAIGVVLLAGMQLLHGTMAGNPVGGLEVSNAFYGVLAYYALMLGTARWWLPALAGLRDPRALLVPLVPALWLAWQGAEALLPPQQLEWLEWPRLMAGRGGYNVFKMTMVAAAGAALGLWIARQRDTRAASGALVLVGGAAAALCLFAMGQIGGFAALGVRSNPAFTSVAGLMFYVAVAAVLSGVGMRAAMAWSRLPGLARLPLKALVVTGGLALPIYVLHQLVRPGRDVLVQAGLPGLPAIAVTMGLFLAAMGYAGRRLWRMYFG